MIKGKKTREKILYKNHIPNLDIIKNELVLFWFRVKIYFETYNHKYFFFFNLCSNSLCTFFLTLLII